MRSFKAGSLILAFSWKSIARVFLASSPALKSLCGSGRLAPWKKFIFTFPLKAPTATTSPSWDQTAVSHFHSSVISGSASRMILRSLAIVLPRQSASSAIRWSMSSDAFIHARSALTLYQPARSFSCGRLRLIVIDCSELSADEKLALAMQISDTLDGTAIALVKGEDIVLDEISQEKPEVF